MHSYADGMHERRARDIFVVEHPQCAVSLSCEVLPEYRQYERAMTTLVYAFVKPPDAALPGHAVLRRHLG